MEDLVKEVDGSDATFKEISSDTVLLIVTVPRHMSLKTQENMKSCLTTISDRAGGIPVLIVADDIGVEAITKADEEISPKRLLEQQQQGDSGDVPILRNT